MSHYVANKDYREIIYKGYKMELDAVQASSDYTKTRNLTKKYLIRNYMKYIPADKNVRILDLGCGLGHYVWALKELGYKNVIGVDTSESNVNFCLSEGLEVVQDDAMRFLNVHKEEFDVIIFNDIIEHFTKQEVIEILDLIRSSLKPNGIVITKTDNVANPFTGVSGRYIDITHEVGFIDLSLMHVFKAMEFKDVKVSGADIYVFGGPIGFLIKGISKVVYFVFFLFNCMAGRTSVRTFEKKLICVARKN